MSAEVDLDALAADLDGYSAADCVALLREAALCETELGDSQGAIDALEPTLARPAQQRQVREGYWLLLALAAVLLVWAQGLVMRRSA